MINLCVILTSYSSSPSPMEEEEKKITLKYDGNICCEWWREGIRASVPAKISIWLIEKWNSIESTKIKNNSENFMSFQNWSL